MSQIDISFVDRAVEEIGREADRVVPILQAIQSHYRYLPEEALERVCEISDITPAAIAGVSTFYAQFRHQPVGKHVVHVCHGTACHVKGSGLIHDALHTHLGIREGETTDDEGNYTVQKVACLGCCTLAPVLEIDGVTYGHVTPRKVSSVLADFLRRLKNGGRAKATNGRSGGRNGGAEIRVGLGSCCVAGGSGKVQEALESAVAAIGAEAVVKRVGCVGMCHRTPMVQVARPGEPVAFYANVDARAAREVVSRHFRPTGWMRRLLHAVPKAIHGLLADSAEDGLQAYTMDVREPHVASFLDKQVHIATEHYGKLDPLDLPEYLAHDGFLALKCCVR
jgi:NADH-quinone oxidoreductase subunit F